MLTYCFDLDGTICSQESPENYKNAKPIQSIINKINERYETGNTIYIYTARHMLNCEMTKNWLNKYGVKYHHIFFGKPAAHIFIDDKAISPKNFLNNTEELESILKNSNNNSTSEGGR